jgi:probable F420-dependent oxidoreductase
VSSCGITIPLGVPLADQLDYFAELESLGYTDLWSSEVNGTDAFTPLAAASFVAPSVRLATAIIPTFTRGPACLAQSVASLAGLAPGRFVIGLGSSSNVIVGQWNGLPFERPLARTRDMVRFLRVALTGEKVTQVYDTMEVRNFRLAAVPPVQPPILVAGLREKMLRLAGEEADGTILNWLSAEDVRTVAPCVHAGGPGKEIVARIFVCPSSDLDMVRAHGREFVAAYLNVPVYRKFQEWLGRGGDLAEMWRLWEARDRKAAAAAVPDPVVDDLIVHGTPDECRAKIQRYVDCGVDTPMLGIMPWGIDPRDAARALRPA